MNNKNNDYGLIHILLAWSVHLFTASAAFFGVLTLYMIYKQEYILALWLMGVTVFIDAVDGTFARLFHVKTILPKIDGALLDNIVDYLNYVVTPCFFLLVRSEMLPSAYAPWIIIAITITSSYQFCQSDAKTPDHFFKGFPCYWNIVIFYMFLLNSSATTNAWILTILSILIFVPIKYVYPSRLDYLTKSKPLKIVMHVCSIFFGLSSAFLLWSYPQTNILLLSVSLGYVVLYLILSIYRTWSPLMLASR